MPWLHKSLPRKCSAAPKYRYTATQLTQLWGRHRRAPGGLRQPVKSRLRSTHSGVDKTSPAPWTREAELFFLLSFSLSPHLKPLRSGRSTGADVQVDIQKGVPPARSFLRRETDCRACAGANPNRMPREALGKRSYTTLKSRSSGIKQQTLERMRTN